MGRITSALKGRLATKRHACCDGEDEEPPEKTPKLESIVLSKYVLVREDGTKYTSEKWFVNKALCRDMGSIRSFPSDRMEFVTETIPHPSPVDVVEQTYG